MPMIQPGNAGYVLHSIDSDFDPTFGARNILSYTGIFERIDELYDSYVAVNARCSVQNLGYTWKLRVTLGAEYTPIVPPATPTSPPALSQAEVPQVSYFIRSASVGTAISAYLPGMRDKLLSVRTAIESGVFGSAIGDGSVEDFIAGCENVVRSSRAISGEEARKTAYEGLQIGTLQPEQQYLKILFQKQDAKEKDLRKWPVLTRTRTYSSAFTDPVNLNEASIVRTTPTLVATFGIPAGIAARLPANPAAVPQNSVYGWREVQSDSRYTAGNNRFEEVVSWRFQDWPTVNVEVL